MMRAMRLVVGLLVVFVSAPVAAQRVRTVDATYTLAPVTDVLADIAEVAKVNIIVSDRVNGKVTMTLGKTRWDHALMFVLAAKGLAMERVGDIIWVDTPAGLRAEREARKKLRNLRVKTQPMVILILPVSYAEAGKMAELLRPRLSVDGSLTVDERTNSIIIKDHEDAIGSLQELAAKLGVGN